MKNKISKILQMNKFFLIKDESNDILRYQLLKPGQILLKNIYKNWLQFIYQKTEKHIPVYLDTNIIKNKNVKIPYGYIIESLPKYNDYTVEYKLNEVVSHCHNELQINFVIPQQETMQYFMQWQRYRKFWWSSITTTPSLFSIGNITNSDGLASVDINANFEYGSHPVETIKVTPMTKAACISCSFNLENALVSLLLDAKTTCSDYLQLHRKMAPYKIAFALDFKEDKDKSTLEELSTLLYHRLQSKRINTYRPNFNDPLKNQINENLSMGVTYTAILDDNVLKNGIFQLLNSNTRLKEQIHIADFDSYAHLICSK